MPERTTGTQQKPGMHRIRELDGLRAVAILLVLGCHYEGFSQFAWRIPEFGWIGVELFFCLSGYLITSILLGMRGRATPYKTFYARRLIRILPPYLAVILVVGLYNARNHAAGVTWVARQLLFLQAFHREQFRAVLDVVTHVRWYAHHLPPLLTLAHALPAEQNGAPLVISIVPFILWSLSIEEYFYLLWAPVALKLPRKAIVLTGVVICAANIFLRWAVASPDVYYSVFFKFDSLLYGAFLALMLERWKRTARPRRAPAGFSALFFVGVMGIAAVLYLIRPVLGADPRSSPLVLVVGLPLLSLSFTALIGLVILKTEERWWLGRILRTRPLQFVGTISYTMYLVHLIAADAIRHVFRVANAFHQTFLQALLSTALTVVLAQISWKYLEKKALEWKDKHFPNAPHPPEPQVVGLS